LFSRLPSYYGLNIWKLDDFEVALFKK